MTSKSARSLAVVLLLAVSSPMAAQTTSPVSASRYVLWHQLAPDSSFIQPVEAGRIQELCGDEDGCTLTIKLEGNTTTLGALSTHLFYGTALTKWETEPPTNTSGLDGNAVENVVAQLDLPLTAFCNVTDGDDESRFDNSPGFLMEMTTPSGANLLTTCQVVFAD